MGTLPDLDSVNSRIQAGCAVLGIVVTSVKQRGCQLRWALQPSTQRPEWQPVLWTLTAIHLVLSHYERHVGTYSPTERRASRRLFNIWTEIGPTLNRCCTDAAHSFQAPLIWLSGRVYLAKPPQTRAHRGIKELLLQHGVTLASYTWQWFCQQFGVYLVCTYSSEKFYIGSTGDTVAGRHNTRTRKYKQLCNRRLISCEVAIRHWHRTRCFYRTVTILYRQATDRLHAYALEGQDIQRHQPMLNWPRVLQVVADKNAQPHASTSGMTIGTKLYARYRFKLLGTQAHDHQAVAWTQLDDLGSRPLRAFTAARR